MMSKNRSSSGQLYHRNTQEEQQQEIMRFTVDIGQEMIQKSKENQESNQILKTIKNVDTIANLKDTESQEPMAIQGTPAQQSNYPGRNDDFNYSQSDLSS